jgi:geranylgeranyl diphosphate synthase type I
MVEGKTAALLAACTEIGALIAEVDHVKQNAYRSYGQNLGLAFQTLDDILGIWGDSEKIGKSVDSDLVTGKKSLPVLYGLAQGGEFSKRWLAGPISVDEVQEIAKILEREGAHQHALKEANRLTQNAIQSLEQADPKGEAGDALVQLTYQLLQRDV